MPGPAEGLTALPQTIYLTFRSMPKNMNGVGREGQNMVKG